jgi:hypothetical protein
LQDVTGLGFFADATTDYEFEFAVPHQGPIVLALDGPASPILLVYRVTVTDEYATVNGLLRNGETAGRLICRFRPDQAGQTVTVHAGAMVRWHAY